MNDAAEKITVMLVDDHAIVREGVRAFLRTLSDIEVIGEARSGGEAVELAAQLVPDVVLMDLVMGKDMDGVEATRQVKHVSPRTQVVVLTSYHEDEHIFPALRAGALSYVLKEVEAENLADVIRKAAHGEAVLHPSVAKRVIDELHGMKPVSRTPNVELSDREMEVLRLIAGGMSNAEIAAKLVISEKTVKAHVSNILNKLQLSDRTRAAVYAWQQGLVRRADFKGSGDQ